MHTQASLLFIPFLTITITSTQQYNAQSCARHNLITCTCFLTTPYHASGPSIWYPRPILCLWVDLSQKTPNSWILSSLNHCLLIFSTVFLDFNYLFLERGEGREKGRETSNERETSIGFLSKSPQPGIEPATQACTLTRNKPVKRWHPTEWATWVRDFSTS